MRAAKEYNIVSKSFHWLIVGMLLVEFTVGWIMPGLRRAVTPPQLVGFHMSFGIVILFVMLMRLLWRLTHPVLPLESSMPEWQEHAARLTHSLLYAGVIVLPLTGWWLASSHGWAVNVFGVMTLPPLVAASTGMENIADFAHIATATAVIGLIGVHVLAGMYHYFIVRDKVVQRMLPNTIKELV